MKLTLLAGRILFAVPFAASGFFHVLNASAMAGMVPPFIPGGVFWVYLTGACMLAAAAALVTGVRGKEACYGLAAMLVVFILTIHLPHMSAADPQMKQMAMMGFLKDTGLLGGALGFSCLLKSK